MDIFGSVIPDIKVKNYGAKRKPLEIIETRIILEAWDGYLYKHRENGKEITDGKVTLDFGGYNRDFLGDWRTQINAYHHLLQHQDEIRDNILRALTEKVDSFTQCLDPDDWFVPNITPENKADFNFKPFIAPLSISFDDEESKDDLSYLQWHFQCVWDVEHGFTVTTHGVRVIDINQEIDPFKIYEDNGTLAEKEKEYEEQMKNFKPKKTKKTVVEILAS